MLLKLYSALTHLTTFHRIQIDEMANQSSVREFVLMGFSDDSDLQILHSAMFFIVYVTALTGNSLIITAVAVDHNLHNSMYYFLVNLSILNMCSIFTTVPKSIAVSLTNNKGISLAGCIIQTFLIVTFVGCEAFLLTIMAYDCYVAICHPLQYRLIMNWNACIQIRAISFLFNLMHAVLETCLTFQLDFCESNVMGQYFCDIPQLQKISCRDTKFNETLILVGGFFLDSFFPFIFASYTHIFSAVIKIRSVQSRHKVFSTYIPHLTVFSLFIITGVFSYMRPKSLSTQSVDLLSAVLYTILPPVLNPIIYSFRNKDLQKALIKILLKIIILQHVYIKR
ncbi:olfactory receptor 14C36-like [Notechis scutatus]|uniref:Olfactory receptor 14C36-like n=1 Tax=Notechis scutatus TaxID=8663 RepID=A0A6J1VDU1_9SAUR|nr:olfactory receptor 14C36-like [Notechis scutatus]